MKYIRTEDEEFIKYFRKQGKIYLIHKTNKDLWWIYKKGNKEHTLPPEYVKVNYYNDIADTIEGLIQVGDLIRITVEESDHFDCYELLEVNKNILELIQDEDFDFKDSIIEFYIKVGNDYKCVAKMNDKGDLELI